MLQSSKKNLRDMQQDSLKQMLNFEIVMKALNNEIKRDLELIPIKINEIFMNAKSKMAEVVELNKKLKEKYAEENKSGKL